MKAKTYVRFMSDLMSGHVLKCLLSLKSCLSSIPQQYKFVLTRTRSFYPGSPNTDRDDCLPDIPLIEFGNGMFLNKMTHLF